MQYLIEDSVTSEPYEDVDKYPKGAAYRPPTAG